MYDKRTNQQWRNPTKLLDSNMVEANGQALFVYNDSVFSDKDFENLTKLGAGTKKEIKDNVGNFGLGFNSVYNLTDVPSIISRNDLVILDPNKKYLKNRIKDNSHPGVRVNLNKLKREDRIKYSDQFKPYENIFGCQPFSEDFNFNSTLFRLPLRREASKISDLVYNEQQVEQLFEILYTSAKTLLLFTQFVRKIEFHVLEDSNGESFDAKLLFEFDKKPCQYLMKHHQVLNLKLNFGEEPSNLEFKEQSSILKASIEASKAKSKFESGMILCNTLRTNLVSFKSFFGENQNVNENEVVQGYWLIVSSFDSSYLVHNDSDFIKFLPCVGMAIEVE
jgi:sacsin